MKTLYPEQRAAIDAVHAAFVGGMSRPLVVLPTGAGKSVVHGAFVKEALEQWPDERILSLVHSQTLVEQNFLELKEMWPYAPASIYCAGLGKWDLSGQVVFGSIQSIYKKAYELQKVDLILVDEAHLIPTGDSGMYNKLFADLATINGGHVPIVGLTATDYRTDTGSLTEGRGKIFDEVVFRVELADLIGQDRLVPPRCPRVKTQIDTTNVKTTAGEFNLGQLQLAADREELTRAAVAEMVDHGRDRRSWIVFSTGVDHAFHIRDEIRSHGITAETVTGDTSTGQRKAIIAAFKAGEIRALTNDSCLTTGFNHPGTDLVAILRPTKSPGLFVQMAGRGLRTAPGKQDCLLMDYGGNIARHGPLDMIKGKAKGDKGAAPVKDCPQCECVVFAGLTVCPHCGYEWEIEREREKHDSKAAIAPALGSTVSDWLPVTKVDFKRHEKPGSKPCLRVDYSCGLTRYSDFVFFEHEGYPRDKAVKWWKSIAGNETECPQTTEQAFLKLLWHGTRPGETAILLPSEIRVRRDGKFWRVVSTRRR